MDIRKLQGYSNTLNKLNKRYVLADNNSNINISTDKIVRFLEKNDFSFDIAPTHWSPCNCEVNILVLYKGEFFDAETDIGETYDRTIENIIVKCFDKLEHEQYKI